MRLKIGEPCNWSCHFCHNEGDKKADTIKVDADFESTIGGLQEKLGVREVHLTGGEPTLNPNLRPIIETLKKSGLEVKMTSNGQFNDETRSDILASGLDSISVSLHSLDPDEIEGIMDRKNLTGWGMEQVQRSKNNILTLASSGTIRVKVNTVISTVHDVPRVQDIFWWSAKNSVEMRVLGNLYDKTASDEAVQLFLEQMQAKLKTSSTDHGTSDKKDIYGVEGVGCFTLKRIEKVFLTGPCEKCIHMTTGTCQEGFYNIRVQKFGGLWYVILCIQNQNRDTVMPLEEFVERYGKK